MKVICVSGGSKGLGKGVVEDLLRHGYSVATYSRSKTEFIEKTQEAESSERFYWESIEGTDLEALKLFAQKVFRKYGQIDGLINNVGMASDGILTLMNSGDIDQLISLNLKSPLHLTQTCAKYMLQQGRGIIINISSIVGIRGHSGVAVYSATKSALDGFTRSLARELGGRNICVNAIAPGYMDTEMGAMLGEAKRKQIIRRTPLNRLGKVEDIVGMVRFLLSKDAEFITGQTLIIDGGLTC
ncbi:MAG: SDR family oxidoreductase [Kiritimatiellae bacterium]|nr:SDR family oxidoreductase [Kiritimatiellia bacterium]